MSFGTRTALARYLEMFPDHRDAEPPEVMYWHYDSRPVMRAFRTVTRYGYGSDPRLTAFLVKLDEACERGSPVTDEEIWAAVTGVYYPEPPTGDTTRT